MKSSDTFFDPKIAARLGAQTLYSRQAMEGTVSGHHKSPHRGSSVEFAEYRNYVPGDDIRRLDWRVFARTDRFYLKEFEAETNLRCYIVIDCSGSMGFGSGEASKLDYALKLASIISYLVIHQGDAAGLLGVQEKVVTEIPTKRNPAHLSLLFDTMGAMKAEGKTGIVEALHQLAEKVRRRALILVFSDFFCDLDPLVGALRHLRFQKHDLGVFQLMDRQELTFEFDRPIRFQDMESNFNLVAEPAMIRNEYLAQVNHFLTTLKRACLEWNTDYHSVVTDQDPEKVLAQFLLKRAQR